MRKILTYHPSLKSITFWFLLLLPAAGLLAGCTGNDLRFPTEFQAVFLDNGQVFFGRLEDVGSSFLGLRDVFYVQRTVTPDKKEASVLIKRGIEWHGPDFMRINSRHVVYIEPVAPDSRVAQLIREAKKPPAPAPKTEEKAPPARPGTGK